jgi:hypothetical protein
MALRPDEPAHGQVKKLARSLPGTAEAYPLPDMNLGGDESHRLVAFVREAVPAAAKQSDEHLLKMIDGYPGVLYQWTSDYQRERMRTLADLEKVANDAQNYRFSDVEELLPKLDGDERRLAIRLALLPIGSGELFRSVRVEILDDISGNLIDDLRLSEVLEDADPPSFGHAKRWEAARTWFTEKLRATTPSEAEGMILRLAASVQLADSQFLPHVLVLSSLLPLSHELDLSDVCKALCQAAETLLTSRGEMDDE